MALMTLAPQATPHRSGTHDALAVVDDAGSFDNSRIMVVDDNPRVATLMSRLLEPEGFRHVVTAGDGQTALDIVVDHQPHVVVLDVHLPRLDGFEVMRQIARRDAEVGRVTGVVAVSGDLSPATCTRCCRPAPTTSSRARSTTSNTPLPRPTSRASSASPPAGDETSARRLEQRLHEESP